MFLESTEQYVDRLALNLVGRRGAGSEAYTKAANGVLDIETARKDYLPSKLVAEVVELFRSMIVP